MVDRTQHLLEAMDGVALILDTNLIIRKIGDRNWTRFLEENRGEKETPGGSVESSIGHPITVFIAGEFLQQTFTGLFLGVLDGRRKAIRLEYRCDAPALRRNMRLSVTRLSGEGGERQLLYQSVLLSSEPRAPLQLFASEISEQDAPDILTLCAICARVAWPVGAPSGSRDWIEPGEYYRRNGPEPVRISHGFCESCYAELSEGE